MQEYFLGKYTMEKFAEMLAQEKKDIENDITRHPPTKVITYLHAIYLCLLINFTSFLGLFALLLNCENMYNLRNCILQYRTLVMYSMSLRKVV